MVWQLQEYDMCIARNEEALRIQPQFAECYGNMANAWKVNSLSFTWSVLLLAIIIFIYMWSDLSLRKKGTLIVQSATTWLPLRFVQTLMLLFHLHYFFLTLSFRSFSWSQTTLMLGRIWLAHTCVREDSARQHNAVSRPSHWIHFW